jgi:uncharacterized protein (DUF2235 family)
MINRYLKFISFVVLSGVGSACATIEKKDNAEENIDQADPIKYTFALEGDPDRKKSIFVFLDGTNNGSKSNTNVWRLYELVESTSKTGKQVTGIYISGVGTTEQPQFNKHAKVPGLVFGQGMEARIRLGYDFIAKNYNDGDDIFIFGFSRGAHQARSLAGFISYVGVPIRTAKSESYGEKEWDKVVDMVKKQNDVDYVSYWKLWQPGAMPPLANQARSEIEVDFQPAQIKMLGIWDTVPGSSLKKFGECKELPDAQKGDRYKSDSYPSIRTIAHAVSIDEKRNMFRPILICPALYPDVASRRTQVVEKWFPGAHADVGGGYSDDENNSLPNISFNWMVGVLAENYKFPSPPTILEEDPNALAHWSVGDMSKIPFIKCEDRNSPPHVSDARHPSADLRVGNPPIRVKGRTKYYPYPILCANEELLISSH